MAPTTSSSVTFSGHDLPEVLALDVASGVIWLRGEHDLSTVPELSAALTGAIMVDESDVVVDMAEVQFMDATIVGVFLQARELLRARSRCLVLRSPPRCVRRVLELCDCQDLLPSAETTPDTGTADAVASVVVGHREDELTAAVAGRGAP
jgi:anti-anti-sigma factor